MNRQENQQGFTLVELMIVIAVIAILATLGLVGFRSAQESARDTQRMNNIRGIQAALECHYSTAGSYPTMAAFKWQNLTSTFGSCWSGEADLSGSPAGDDAPGGTGASVGIVRSTATVGSYIYTIGDTTDDYTVTLWGESRTVSVESPS